MTGNEIESAVDALFAHPVAYYPAFAIIMESGNGGIVLSQLVFQARRFGWAEFWHKDCQIIEETGLSLKQVRVVKNKLKDVPFVGIRIADMPAKTYYRIDRLNLFKFMATANQNGVFSRISQYAQKGQTRMPKRAKLECPKGPNIETVLETEESLSPMATPRPPTSGKWQKLFHKGYEAKFHRKYPGFNCVGGACIKNVQKALGGDIRQFKKILPIFFDDKWAAGDVKLLLSQMPRWLERLANPPNIEGNGRAAPGESFPAPVGRMAEGDVPIEW